MQSILKNNLEVIMKRSLSLLLAALLLAAATGCGNKEPVKDTAASDTSSAEVESETAAPESETKIDYAAALPEANYDGYSFRMLSKSPEKAWGLLSLDADEATGDVLNDFVFERNSAIEERYNIIITNQTEENITGMVKKSVNGGTDEFDIVLDYVKQAVTDAPSGYYQNLWSIDSINLDNPWWNKTAAELLTIKNRVYVGFNDFNTQIMELLAAFYFNSDVIMQNGLTSPYILVEEGRWTMDAMYEQAVTCAVDRDGDGVIGEGDMVGWVGGAGSFNILFNSCDSPHIYFDENCNLALSHGMEKMYDVSVKISRLMTDKSFSAYINNQPWANDAFANGNAAFREGSLSEFNKHRESEAAVCIVPAPKYDEAQEKYRAMMSNCSMGISLPVTVADTDKIGFICEALGAYSHIPLREVYYNTVLKSKLARDEESVKMLDIIVANQTLDIGVINEIAYGDIISGYFFSIRDHGTEQLSSVAAKDQERFTAKVAQIESAYEKLPE